MKAALLSIVTLAIAMISLAEAQVPSGQPGPGVPVNPGYGAPGYGYGAPPPKVEILRIVSSVVSYLTTVGHSNLDFLDVMSSLGEGRSGKKVVCYTSLLLGLSHKRRHLLSTSIIIQIMSMKSKSIAMCDD